MLLFTSIFFSLRTGPLYFYTGCRKRPLNWGYNLSRFILCSSIFVIDHLYLIDFVVIDVYFLC